MKLVQVQSAKRMPNSFPEKIFQTPLFVEQILVKIMSDHQGEFKRERESSREREFKRERVQERGRVRERERESSRERERERESSRERDCFCFSAAANRSASGSFAMIRGDPSLSAVSMASLFWLSQSQQQRHQESKVGKTNQSALSLFGVGERNGGKVWICFDLFDNWDEGFEVERFESLLMVSCWRKIRDMQRVFMID